MGYFLIILPSPSKLAAFTLEHDLTDGFYTANGAKIKIIYEVRA